MSIGFVEFLVILAVSVGATAALARFAGQIGLVDRATSARKVHVGEIPVVGGLAMFGAFVLALAAFVPTTLLDHWALFVGLVVLVGVGAVDDRSELSPGRKALGQILAATIMIVPGHHVLNLAAFLPADIEVPMLLQLVVTIGFVVAIINAFNMIDGLDGLAGGIAVTALGWLAFVAYRSGQEADFAMLLALVGALLGFLAFNMRHPLRKRASVFMGDAGSMMLGAACAYFIIETGHGDQAAGGFSSVAALAWVVAVPALDTASLCVRRPLAGQSPFAADRRHLHHLLGDAGLSPGATTAVVVAISALLGAVGVAGFVFATPAPVMIAGLLVPLAVHTGFVLQVRAPAVVAPALDAATKPQGTGHGVVAVPATGHAP